MQWFEDENLTIEVENPEEVEAGTYYVIFFNENGMNCDEPIAAEMEVIIEDCAFVAIDDVFYLCIGEDSAPQGIFDNDTLGENPENVNFYFEEDLPDWLIVDDEGIIYLSPSAPVGTFTFTYFIFDTENPDFEDSAILTLIIESIFEPIDDYAETDRGEAISINILENDLPEQGIPVDAISLIDPATGNYVNDINIPSEGTYILDVNSGFVTFTPNNDFIGWTSPVEYILENDCGASEPAEIYVFVRNPELEMTKSVNREIEYSEVGETIEYEIIIKNTGNISLYNIEVTDPNSEEVDIGFIEELQPEESQGFVATHIITQSDVEAGFVANIAFAVGETENAVEVSISSYDPNPLDDLPDPDCAECTFAIITTPDPEECYLKVSEGVSPNGDGINDYLKINNGDCDGTIRIKIYNRWGMLVFVSDNYGSGREVFEGYANRSGFMGSTKKLPSATYYYIAEMKADDGLQLKEKGYFFLSTP